jgi:hypothetical protein
MIASVLPLTATLGSAMLHRRPVPGGAPGGASRLPFPWSETLFRWRRVGENSPTLTGDPLFVGRIEPCSDVRSRAILSVKSRTIPPKVRSLTPLYAAVCERFCERFDSPGLPLPPVAMIILECRTHDSSAGTSLG